jgi:hypothetical protein
MKPLPKDFGETWNWLNDDCTASFALTHFVGHLLPDPPKRLPVMSEMSWATAKF